MNVNYAGQLLEVPNNLTEQKTNISAQDTKLKSHKLFESQKNLLPHFWSNSFPVLRNKDSEFKCN
jgi:hypothetical protein